MIPVFMIGGGNDNTTALHIYNTVSREARCALISDFTVCGNSNCEYLFIDCKNAVRIDFDFGAAVIKPDFCGELPHLSDKVTIIADSSSKQALSALKGKKNQIICCGMSVRDTLNLSAVSGDSAFACLNRTITTASGRLCESCETAIRSDSGDRYSMLCAAALLLYGDKVN